MKRFSMLLMTMVILFTLVGCARSDFNQTAALRDIQQALGTRGLQPCAENDLKWTAVPGFVEGKQYDVDTSCTTYDPNFPGARVSIARFDSVEARDGALRNYQTIGRRNLGAGFARAVGPWIIVVDGNRKAAAALIGEALNDLKVP
jgi:hypothetical protein